MHEVSSYIISSVQIRLIQIKHMQIKGILFDQSSVLVRSLDQGYSFVVLCYSTPVWLDRIGGGILFFFFF